MKTGGLRSAVLKHSIFLHHYKMFKTTREDQFFIAFLRLEFFQNLLAESSLFLQRNEWLLNIGEDSLKNLYFHSLPMLAL